MRRRYILRKHALEMFFEDGSSLLFNFPDKDLDIFIERLLQIGKQQGYQLKAVEVGKNYDRSKYLKKWSSNEYSNLKYIMKLNQIGGRSYKDVTQYPVLPWIITDYISDILDFNDINRFRNLRKTMGALGSEKRTREFEEKFNLIDPFNPVPQFHFGSHYSSPAVIF